MNFVILWLVLIILLRFGFSACLHFAGKTGSPQAPTAAVTLETGNVSASKITGDSWLPMTITMEYLDKNPKGNIYDALLYTRVSKFIYPPTSLLVYDVPHRITGKSYWTITNWLNRISWISIFLIGLVSGGILINLLKNGPFEKFKITSNVEAGAVYVLVCVITYFFFPINFAYKIGQIQTLLTLFTALSLLCWQLDKKYLSGLLIGLICLVKPQLAMVLFWAAIRKQWKMIIGSLIVIIPCLLVSIILYGMDNHTAYLSTLSFLSHHGESYFPNQSVNGLMNRLLFNGDNLTYSDKGYPPYNPVVYATTLIAAFLLTIPALFWNYKKKNPLVLDMAMMILATTMASPIAWEHHYGIILPVFIVLVPFAAYFYMHKYGSLLLLSFGFVLTSTYIEFVKRFADSGLNILQSYLFFGACIILGFLFRCSYLEKEKFRERMAG